MIIGISHVYTPEAICRYVEGPIEQAIVDAFCSPLGQEIAIRHELLDAMVVSISYVYISLAVYCYSPGIPEIPIGGTVRSPLTQENAIRRDHLNGLVIAIRHKKIPKVVHCYICGQPEHLFEKRINTQKIAVYSKLLDAVVPCISHVNKPRVSHYYAMRLTKLPGAIAFHSPLGHEFAV